MIRNGLIVLSLMLLSACDVAKSPHRLAAEDMVQLTHIDVLTPIFSNAFAKAAEEKGVLREALQDQLPKDVPEACIANVTDAGSDFAGYLFSSSMVTDSLAEHYEKSMSIETIEAFNNIVSSNEGKKMLRAITNARLGNTPQSELPQTIKNIAMGAISLFSQGSGKTLATSLSTIIPAYGNVIATLGADKSQLKQQFVAWLLQNPEARAKIINATSDDTSCGNAFNMLGTAKDIWDMFQPLLGKTTPQ